MFPCISRSFSGLHMSRGWAQMMTIRDDFDIYGGQWALMSRYELKKTIPSLNLPRAINLNHLTVANCKRRNDL